MNTLEEYKDYDLIVKSFAVDNVTEQMICKAMDALDLVKAKKGEKPHSEGDVRTYKGKSYVHNKGKWEPKKEKALHEHAKETAEKHLKKTTSESKDPVLREHAHKELARRDKEEKPQEKKEGDKKKKVSKGIGNTLSGKVVEKHSMHESHKKFSPDDHKDAAKLHKRKAAEIQEQMKASKKKDPELEAKYKDHLAHSQVHRSAANLVSKAEEEELIKALE